MFLTVLTAGYWKSLIYQVFVLAMIELRSELERSIVVTDLSIQKCILKDQPREMESLGLLSVDCPNSSVLFVDVKNTYMLFTGREVRMGKNCARGLEYGPRPKAEAVLKTKGTVLSHTDRPSQVNNIFIFFWTSSF